MPLQVGQETPTVPPHYFGKTGTPQAKFDPAKLPPADTTVAMRVDRIGRDILAANQGLGVKPYFGTAGIAEPELFHVGNESIWITAGLVERCRGDAEVAGLLGLELAKMVADREAIAYDEDGSTDKQPPMQVPIGNAGISHAPDKTNLIELARFEKENPRRRRTFLRPDPNELARKYLANTDYKNADWNALTPLVRAAEANYTIEKQFQGKTRMAP